MKSTRSVFALTASILEKNNLIFIYFDELNTAPFCEVFINCPFCLIGKMLQGVKKMLPDRRLRILSKLCSTHWSVDSCFQYFLSTQILNQTRRQYFEWGWALRCCGARWSARMGRGAFSGPCSRLCPQSSLIETIQKTTKSGKIFQTPCRLATFIISDEDNFPWDQSNHLCI